MSLTAIGVTLMLLGFASMIVVTVMQEKEDEDEEKDSEKPVLDLTARRGRRRQTDVRKHMRRVARKKAA